MSESDAVEWFQERAAMMQVEANATQAEAEWGAFQCLRRLIGKDNVPHSIAEIGVRAFREIAERKPGV